MKKIVLIALILCISFTSNIIAQNGAQIEYKINPGTGVESTIKICYLGQNIRTEATTIMRQRHNIYDTVSTIEITKSNEPTITYSLNAKNKTYTTLKKTSPDINIDPAFFIVKVLGKAKVGQYNCTRVKVIYGKQISLYWLTTEIPDYKKYKNFDIDNQLIRNDGTREVLEQNNIEGYAIKSEHISNGAVYLYEEITLFEKKDFDPSLFEIPADYTLAAPAAQPATSVTK